MGRGRGRAIAVFGEGYLAVPLTKLAELAAIANC